MSIWSRMEGETKRLKRKRGSSGNRAGVHLQTTPGTDALLAKFPDELQIKVFPKALKASAAPVIASARRLLAPRRSAITGTAKKQSKKTKAERRNREGDLFDAMSGGVKIVQYEGRAVAYIGPRRPIGNHGHLEEYDHVQYLWGKSPIVSRGKPFLEPAADETRVAQAAAFKKVVETEWVKL